MGPDEYHGKTDNNVYTNVVAGLAIYFGQYSSCVGGCPELPSAWLEVAANLALEYSEAENYHPQYRGYEPGTEVKQADTVLVGFPLMYDMESSTRSNDLDIYEAVTDLVRNQSHNVLLYKFVSNITMNILSVTFSFQNGPAMTWSMHAVGHLELGEEQQAAGMFNRSYLPYVQVDKHFEHYKTSQPPFYMWTEVQGGEGAVNFITGMGGFLQAVLFGYLGVRARLDRMDLDPKLPPGCSVLKMQGLQLHGSTLHLSVEEEVVVVEVEEVRTGLEVVQGEDSWVVVEPVTVSLARAPFSLRPLGVEYLERCSLPRDVIGGGQVTEEV